MPVASDIILDWIHEDGYSLSEAGWIRGQEHEFYFEITAAVHLGMLIGYPLEE